MTPRPLFGGGLFVERTGGTSWGASGRLSFDLAATGAFDAGPGGASFLRGMGRLEGCPFVRATRWLALSACVGAEAGFLRGEGVLRGTLAQVQEAIVPWAGLDLLPRVALDASDRLTLALDGGLVFPLVRRSFVFERPSYVIHEVPAVTGSLRLGAGVRF